MLESPRIKVWTLAAVAGVEDGAVSFKAFPDPAGKSGRSPRAEVAGWDCRGMTTVVEEPGTKGESGCVPEEDEGEKPP